MLRPLRDRHPAALYTGQLGGGLVQGDSCNLHVRVEADAHLSVFGQASNKAYAGETALSVHAAIEPGASLAWIGEPMVPYAGARWRGRFELELAERASLVLWESLTAGRIARGERWAAAEVRSDIELRRAGRVVLREALLLRPEHAAANRLGAYGTLILSGRFAADAEALCERLRRAGLRLMRAERDDVVLVRIGCEEPGELSRVRDALAPLAARTEL